MLQWTIRAANYMNVLINIHKCPEMLLKKHVCLNHYLKIVDHRAIFPLPVISTNFLKVKCFLWGIISFFVCNLLGQSVKSETWNNLKQSDCLLNNLPLGKESRLVTADSFLYSFCVSRWPQHITLKRKSFINFQLSTYKVLYWINSTLWSIF